jgi:hypothetical protein
MNRRSLATSDKELNYIYKNISGTELPISPEFAQEVEEIIRSWLDTFRTIPKERLSITRDISPLASVLGLIEDTVQERFRLKYSRTPKPEENAAINLIITKHYQRIRQALAEKS